MRITVIGSGHAALSVAAVLSRENEVKILRDGSIDYNVLLHAPEYGVADLESMITDEPAEALDGAELVVISLIVPYDTELNMYDLHDLDMYMNQAIRYVPGAALVLRSDVPVGYTAIIRNRYPDLDVAFVPDFAREGRSLQDAFEPTRLIMGGGSEKLTELMSVLKHTGTSCIREIFWKEIRK